MLPPGFMHPRSEDDDDDRDEEQNLNQEQSGEEERDGHLHLSPRILSDSLRWFAVNPSECIPN
jgi:hypothetical protein